MEFLNTQISYVKTHQHPPKICTLRDALSGIRNPLNNADRIAKIRSAQQQIEAEILNGNEAEAKRLKDEIKDPEKIQLPGFIFGSICEGSHNTSAVVARTGIVCLDFDSETVQDATSWETFRDEIIKLKYVFFAALSVSGSGVMILLKVKHPDRQREYFEQLKKDFRYLLKKHRAKGIKLDESKGQNPAQLRFLTWDPAAKYKADFAIYDRLPIVTQKRPARPARKHPGTKDIFDFAYKLILSKGFTFTKGSDAHESIFRFCCTLNAYGIDQQEAETWINTNILDLSQIKSNCITDAYSRYKNDFGKKQFNQAAPVRTPVQVAPYGSNPWTKETFDSRGYPAAWDEIEQEARPALKKICALFDAVQI